MGQRSEMYRMRPIFQLPEKIDLPTCMYSTGKIINSVMSEGKCDRSNDILKIIEDKVKVILKKPLPKLIELEERWERVINQVKDLINQVNSIKKELSSIAPCESADSHFILDSKAFANLKMFEGAVISAHPSRPPYSLFLINQICNNSLAFTIHVHSTVNSIPENVKLLGQSQNPESGTNMTLIWKEGHLDSELVLNPLKQISIRGEVNVLRHLGRMGLDFLGYPTNDAYQTIQLDSVLDTCHRLQHCQASKEMASFYRNFNAKLGRSQYFGGEKFNICDIAVWSVLKQVDAVRDLTPNMSKWFNKMDAMLKIR